MMKNARSIVVLALGVAFALATCGCATVVNGTSQKIQVSSDPVGAVVKVDDKSTYTTPARVRLERRKDHALVFTKDGYAAETVKLTHVLSEVVVGNTLLGGPLGWAFDACAGTQYKLIPDPVHVELRKIDTGH